MGVVVDLSASEATIYVALSDAALNGELAPMNDDLAELIDASSTSTVPTIMRRLEEKGMIRVFRYQRSRQVKITATGNKTAAPSNKAIHWRDRPDRTPRPAQDLIARRKPDLARKIMSEALKLNRPVSDFLADLVFVGWDWYEVNEK